MQPEILKPHKRQDTCYQPKMTKPEWRDILTAQAWRCFYCGNFIHEDAIAKRELAEPDHLYPISLGGCSCCGNVVAACGICNRMKQGKLLVDFLADNPYFLKTMGEFSIRILFIPRAPAFWSMAGVDFRALAQKKRLA